MVQQRSGLINDKLSVRGAVQRLGKNVNGYFGEKIDIVEALGECVAAGRTHGWTIEEIPLRHKHTLGTFFRPAAADSSNAQSSPLLRIYISAGIHGDEPAGPLALRQLLQENIWPANASLWICPCLNPSGFALHQRENADGLDLNRQYLEPSAEETKAHIKWLLYQPSFDLCLCLHEDWESEGFYLYELNPDACPSLAGPILSRVANVCPIDSSELIEGRAAQGGLIRPSVDPNSRPQWPESFFLLNHKTRLSYTLEAPSDFPLSVRVAALVEGVKAAVRAVVESGRCSDRSST
jgi:murein peptide amidase A